MIMKSEHFLWLLVSLNYISCGKNTKINGKIAFSQVPETGNINLFSILPDGNGLTQLTNSKLKNSNETIINAHPSFSSDGKYMAFTSTKNGNPSIYMMRVGSNTTQQVTPANVIGEVPSFSPDGQRIAFSGNKDGSFEIFTINIDGTDLKQLTFNNSTNDGPKYTPDGKYIVFSSDVNGTGTPKNRDLYMMSASSGKRLKRITYGMDNRFSRSLSPDGKRIVFSSTKDNVGNLFIVNINGKGMQQISNVTGNGSGFSPLKGWPLFNGAITPAWSPDGKYIAYADNSNGKYSIYKMYVKGKLTSQVVERLTFQNNDISVGWQSILKKFKY